ncbi:MAG: hypothetical protein JKY09_07635 [Crocinitomicaceae bacterium]|nr:hypothetical protein [Crocinitomicaceae bacterium]
MKNLLAILFICITSISFSQISFRTGDTKLDAELNIANQEAEKDMVSFKKNLTLAYKISAPKIESLLKIMKPAEVLLTAKISSIAKKPIDTVVNSYKKNKGKGWGAVAKEMGIKPGSAEFHALKGKPKKSKGPKGKAPKHHPQGKKKN